MMAAIPAGAIAHPSAPQVAVEPSAHNLKLPPKARKRYCNPDPHRKPPFHLKSRVHRSSCHLDFLFTFCSAQGTQLGLGLSSVGSVS
jgi:hypothetical protein